MWSQAIWSAVVIWLALLLFGGAAIAITSTHSDNQDALRRSGWLMTQAERQEAEKTISGRGTIRFWLWGLTVVIWVANIYDARGEAIKYNKKMGPASPAPAASPGGLSFQPVVQPPVADPSLDPSARLLRLVELRKAGALTEEEFQTKKQEVLSRL